MIPQSEFPKALRLDLATMQVEEVVAEQMAALKELAGLYQAQKAAGIGDPVFNSADIAEAGIE